MNLKEAFDHLNPLTLKQREDVTVCSVYYDPSDDKFAVIELRKNADEQDLENPEDSEQYFYVADYEAGRIGSLEGEENFYGGMTLEELVEDCNNKNKEVPLDKLSFQVFHDIDSISGLMTEYVLFELFPELLEFDIHGEDAVVTNPDGFKKEAIRLVKEKFPLSL